MAATRTLRVEDAAESRQCLLEAPSNRPGPAREIVALNAGAALYAAGVASNIADGIARARQAIASGAARAKLDDYEGAWRRLGGLR